MYMNEDTKCVVLRWSVSCVVCLREILVILVFSNVELHALEESGFVLFVFMLLRNAQDLMNFRIYMSDWGSTYWTSKDQSLWVEKYTCLNIVKSTRNYYAGFSCICRVECMQILLMFHRDREILVEIERLFPIDPQLKKGFCILQQDFNV